MAFGDGHMPYEDFARLMREEMERVSELEKRLAELPENTRSTITFEEAVRTIRGLKENWFALEQSTRKQIVQSIFQSITIKKENGKWKITDITLA